MAKFEIKYVLLTHGILAFLFGVGFMLIPIPLMTMMGLSTAVDTVVITRILGSTIFGIGLVAFSFRKEPHSALRQHIILTFILVYTVMTVFNIIFFDLTNFMVWSLILLHPAFVVVYGYFFRKNHGK